MKKVTFLITNSCNFNCKHCFVNAGKKLESELVDEKKYEAIDKLCDLGVRKITFSGGEPLMNKNIFNYIEYAKNKGVEIGFLTNGLLLSKEKINRLKSLVNTFSISLYSQDILGITDELYKRYICKMIRVLKKLTSMKFNFKITIPISMVNQKKAIELIEMIYKEKIKAETIRVYMITPLGRAKENKEICTEEMNCVDILKILPEEVQKSDLNISFEQSSINKNEINSYKYYTYCPIIEYENSYINEFGDPHMDVNGDLYLCGLLLRDSKYCIGNIITDDKGKIFKNIDKIVDLIKNQKNRDCCPALNRETKENEKLVCPVIYLKRKL